jgi:hypothetical protein
VDDDDDDDDDDEVVSWDVDEVLVAVDAATVPDGEGPRAIYPYKLAGAFPHRSGGKPGHGLLQFETLAVSPGATFEHQQDLPWRIANA